MKTTLLGLGILIFSASTPVFASGDPECSVENGFPVAALLDQPLCPPYRDPLVVFAPHPDDETLGMSLPIREAVLAGRTVIVELLTRGTASHAGEELGLTPEKLGEARVLEFLDACRRLGVTGVRINSFHDGSLTEAQAKTRVDFWMKRNDPGLSFVTTAGPQDPPAHPDHISAFHAVRDAHLPATSFRAVYAFDSLPVVRELGNKFITQNLGESCDSKRDALQAYAVENHAIGRYAIGWKNSVGGLFDEASRGCDEYELKREEWNNETIFQMPGPMIKITPPKLDIKMPVDLPKLAVPRLPG
jgi:LmbE family N-acetylglucosaminyl deacetylase